MLTAERKPAKEHVTPFRLQGTLSVWPTIEKKRDALAKGENDKTKINLIVGGGAMLFPAIAAFLHVLTERDMLSAFNNIYVTSAAAIVFLYAAEVDKHGIVDNFIEALTEGEETLIDFRRLLKGYAMEQQVFVNNVFKLKNEKGLPNLEKFSMLPPIFATIADYETGILTPYQINKKEQSLDDIIPILRATSCIPGATKGRFAQLPPTPQHPYGQRAVDGGLHPLVGNLFDPSAHTLIFSPFLAPKNFSTSFGDLLIDTAAYYLLKPFLGGKEARQVGGILRRRGIEDMQKIRDRDNNCLLITPKTTLPASPFATKGNTLYPLSRTTAQGIEGALKLYLPPDW